MGAISTYVENRVTRLNTNADIAIVGSRGCGKSYAALRLGEVIAGKLDTPFSIEGNLFFDARGLLERIDTLTKGKTVDEVQPGHVLVLDEAGISVNAQEWWDQTIQALSTEYEVFRTYRFCTIMTTPAIGNITKRIRGMMSCIMKPILPKVPERRDLIHPTSNIDFRNKRSRWRFYVLWSDPAPTRSQATTAMPMYRPRGREGGVLDTVWVRLPSKHLLGDYEEKKRGYLDSRRTEKLKKLKAKDIDKKEINHIVDKVCRDIKKYRKLYHDRWIVSYQDIGAEFNISQNLSKAVKARVERRINT